MAENTEIACSPCEHCTRIKQCFRPCKERYDYWELKIGAIRRAVFGCKNSREEDTADETICGGE